MGLPKLTVEVSAHFDWMEPPSNEQEELLRQRANIIAGNTAARLNESIRMIVLEMVSLRVGN